MAVMLHWLIFFGGISLLLLRFLNLRQFLLTVIFMMPFNGIFVESGQRIELFKVASLLVIPLAASHLPQFFGLKELKLFIPFSLWVVWISLLSVCYSPDYIFDSGIGMRTIGFRSTIQIVLLFSRLSLIGLFFISFTKAKDVWAGLRSLIAATTVLVLFGILEQLCHLAGFDVGGVYYGGLNGGAATHLHFSAFGIDFKRIGSFAHEPKMLARWIIPSTVVLIFDSLRSGTLTGKTSRSRNLAFLHMFALLFTFSTSGYIVFLLSLVVPLFSAIRDHGRKLRYACMVFLIGTIAAFYMSQSGLFEKVIGRKIEIYGSLLQGGSDGPGWNFLQQNPLASIWGAGWAMQGFYLPQYISKDFEFVYGSYADIGFGGFGVESGWLSLILNVGLIGLILFMAPIYLTWCSSSRVLRINQTIVGSNYETESIVLLRCLFGCYLIGMVAYQLESVGGIAVSLGLLMCSVRNARIQISQVLLLENQTTT